MANIDDLRYFLALARHRSLVKAAEHVGASRTTVARRVASIEQELGHRVFDKSPHGWVLTPQGEALITKAEAIEAAADELFTTGRPQHAELTGSVRLVTNDAFGQYVLTGWLAQLRHEHPGIRVELVTAMRVSPFNGGDFDVAITVHRPDLVHVETRPLIQYSLGIYAADSYLADRPEPTSVDELAQHDWVWFVESLNDIPALQFLRPLVPSADIVAAFSSVSAQIAAAAAGIGLGFLPQFAAAELPDLRRLLSEQVSIERTFYLAARNASLAQPHVAATVAFLVRKAKEDAHRF